MIPRLTRYVGPLSSHKGNDTSDQTLTYHTRPLVIVMLSLYWLFLKGSQFSNNSFRQILINLINLRSGNLQLLINAWTLDSMAIEWLKKVFIPFTNTLEPRLLILDGYSSYKTTDFIYLCY